MKIQFFKLSIKLATDCQMNQKASSYLERTGGVMRGQVLIETRSKFEYFWASRTREGPVAISGRRRSCASGQGLMIPSTGCAVILTHVHLEAVVSGERLIAPATVVLRVGGHHSVVFFMAAGDRSTAHLLFRGEGTSDTALLTALIVTSADATVGRTHGRWFH